MNWRKISNLSGGSKFKLKETFSIISSVKNVESLSLSSNSTMSEILNRILLFMKKLMISSISGQFFFRDDEINIFIIRFKHYIDGTGSALFSCPSMIFYRNYIIFCEIFHKFYILYFYYPFYSYLRSLFFCGFWTDPCSNIF